MLDVISHLFELGSGNTIAEFVLILWLILNRWNKVLYQQIFDPLDDIPFVAVSLHAEYCMANAQEPASLPMKPRMQWCPPSLLPLQGQL